MGNIMDELDFSPTYYEELCERMRQIYTQEKALAAEKVNLKKSMVDYAGGERMENGIKLSFVDPTTLMDYKKLIADLDLSEELLSQYRKPKAGYWTTKPY